MHRVVNMRHCAQSNDKKEITVCDEHSFADRHKMSVDYDYMVVGAGVNGSWAAYHLAQRGNRVLLVDKVGRGWFWLGLQIGTCVSACMYRSQI